MSWDVLLLNYEGNPPTPDGEEEPPSSPLGPAAEVRASLARALPGIDWSEPAWGVYQGDGFTIELNTGTDDPIESIMLHVRGEGDAPSALRAIAAPHRWSLYDLSADAYLDPDDPDAAGWDAFRAYRDRAVGPRGGKPPKGRATGPKGKTPRKG